MATVMTIEVAITGQNAGLVKSVQSTNQSLGTLGSTATKTSGIMGKLGSMGVPLAAGLGAAVFMIGKAFVQAGIEAERVNAQTTAGLTSTGGAANVTLSDIRGLADGIMSYSGIGDEAIQTGENMLLTFTNIRNEVGAGNDIFDQATMAMADMATKMNGGVTPAAEQMSQTAIQMGKALNDPIKGITALSRVGVAFTAEQKAQITTLVQTGRILEAQKIILGELTTEFGGSAKAMGSTFMGQWNIMKESVMNVVETIMVAIFRLVQPIVSALIPAFQVLGKIVGVVARILAAAFSAVQPFIQPLLIGIAAIGAIIVAVLIPSIIASGVAWMAAWGPVIVIALAVIAVVTAIGAAIMGVVKLVQAGFAALSGGWSKMSAGMKAALIILAPLWLPIVVAIKLVVLAVKAIWAAIQVVWNAIKGFVSNWIAGMKVVGEAIGAVIGWIGKAIGAIGDFVGWLGKISGVSWFAGVISDIQEANAAAAAADLRTWGLQVVTAAQTSNAAIVDMTMAIEHMKAVMPKEDFAAAMAVGIQKIDDAFAAGTMSATEARKAYQAWGMSIQAAAQKVAAAADQNRAAAKIVVSSSQIMSGAMSRLGSVGKITEAKLVAAFRKSAQAAAQLASNSTKVAQRFSQATGMSEQQASELVKTLQSEFGDKAPQIMAILAKSSSKNFASMAKNILTGRAGYEDFAGAVGDSAKVAGQVAGAQKKLGDETKKTGDAAKGATQTTQSLGNSVQTAGSKSSSAATQVAKLHSELDDLPRNITIQVTVNITKTGAALGGVVPGLARGGITANSFPLTMVGEHGPELAALPPGTRVFSHNDTSGMLRAAMDQAAGSGGGGPMAISGKLMLVNGEAYIEGVVVDVLEDGRTLDRALTQAMRNP